MGAGATILNVDDDDAGRYVITRVLRNAGFQVIEARSGGEALHLLSSQPDLILLDVNLPDISGLEVCQRIKSNPAAGAIPILYLSATSVAIEDIETGLSTGADGYLTEPVEPEELIANVRTLLRLREAEDALRETSAHLQLLVRQMPAVLWAIDADLRVTSCLGAGVAALGLTASSVRGLDLSELFRAVPRAAAEAAHQRALSGESGTFDVEWAGRTFHGQVEPFHGSDGSITGAIGVALDVTEQRHTAAALRRREHELRTIMDRSTAVMYLKDVEGKYLTANRQYELLTHTDPDQLPGKTDYDIFAREEADLFRANDQQVLQSGATVQVEENVTLNGRLHTFLEIKFPLCDASGVPYAVCGIATDITERKQTEEALQRQADLLELAHDAIIVRDPDGTIRFWNRGAEELYGWSRAEALGQVIHTLLGTRFPDSPARLEQTLTESGAWEGELIHTRRDGAQLVVASRHALQRNAAGEPVAVLEINRDVTAIKQAHELLAQANRSKDEFITVLAHELRNPLGAISNAGHLLAETFSNDPRVTRWARTIRHQTEHLTRLVEDLLDTARIQSGKVSLRLEPVELRAAVEAAVESCRPLIDSRQHRLSVLLPPGSCRLQADPTRLEQIICNLLNNAAKYTEPGGQIRIEGGKEGAHVVLRVRDTGRGIPPEMLPRIFHLFTQVDPAVDRARGGLGVGLALVRSLVEMHGGTLEAHSEGSGQGSEFVVRFPGK
jgi:PAS domain S-box-containing protein